MWKWFNSTVFKVSVPFCVWLWLKVSHEVEVQTSAIMMSSEDWIRKEIKQRDAAVSD